MELQFCESHKADPPLTKSLFKYFHFMCILFNKRINTLQEAVINMSINIIAIRISILSDFLFSSIICELN